MNSLREKVLHQLYNRLDWVNEVICSTTYPETDYPLFYIAMAEHKAILTVIANLGD